MIRRLVFAAAVLTTLAAPMTATAAHAQDGVDIPKTTSNEYGDWWCIAVRPLDVGFCQGNPMPELPKVTQLLPPLPGV